MKDSLAYLQGVVVWLDNRETPLNFWRDQEVKNELSISRSSNDFRIYSDGRIVEIFPDAHLVRVSLHWGRDRE